MTMELVGLVGGAFCFGLLVGYIACVFIEVKGLREQVVTMKKQGFVPQFSVNNERELDPSEDINEY